jgi:hypothetical protein
MILFLSIGRSLGAIALDAEKSLSGFIAKDLRPSYAALRVS